MDPPTRSSFLWCLLVQFLAMAAIVAVSVYIVSSRSDIVVVLICIMTFLILGLLYLFYLFQCFSKDNRDDLRWNRTVEYTPVLFLAAFAIVIVCVSDVAIFSDLGYDFVDLVRHVSANTASSIGGMCLAFAFLLYSSARIAVIHRVSSVVYCTEANLETLLA